MPSARQHLACVTIVVPDYDIAIAFYVGTLGFTLAEDTVLSSTKRWVRVALPGATETTLLLASATDDRQLGAIGNQTGGRVFLFLHTDDFERDFARYTDAGVEFVRPPRTEAYGRVAVFRDPFGNLWDLIEPVDDPGSISAPREG